MSRILQLSTGQTVTVGKLTWKAYKSLKSRMLELLSRDILQLFESGGLTDSNAWQEIVTMAGHVIPELDEQFAAGCVQGSILLGDLPFDDVQMILTASQELNPLEQILEFEKNSVAGALAARLFRKFQGTKNGDLAESLNQLQAGGSLWSASSSSSGTGDPQT